MKKITQNISNFNNPSVLFRSNDNKQKKNSCLELRKWKDNYPLSKTNFPNYLSNLFPFICRNNPANHVSNKTYVLSEKR